jgi:hypothetical protein
MPLIESIQAHKHSILLHAPFKGGVNNSHIILFRYCYLLLLLIFIRIYFAYFCISVFLMMMMVVAFRYDVIQSFMHFWENVDRVKNRVSFTTVLVGIVLSKL